MYLTIQYLSSIVKCFFIWLFFGWERDSNTFWG